MSMAGCRAFRVFAVTAIGTLGFMAVLVPSAARAGDRYVRPGGVDSGDCSSPSAACATLGYAVDQALDWDVVRVARGVYSGGASVGNGAYHLTIQGGWSRDFTWRDPDPSATTLDGTGVHCATYDAPSRLKLEGLTIQNALVAVEYWGQCAASLEATVLHGNQTGATGARSLAVVNSLIIDNGYGISVDAQGWEATVTVESSTIAGNTVGLALSSSGLPPSYFGDVAGTVTNSIVHTNGTDLELGIENLFAACSVEVSFTDVGVVSQQTSLPCTYTEGAGVIGHDPGFAGPGDYHLAAGSVCIDSGSNDSAPADDCNGELRPFDGDGDGTAITDMGADEYWPYPAGPLLFWDDFELGNLSAWSLAQP